MTQAGWLASRTAGPASRRERKASYGSASTASLKMSMSETGTGKAAAVTDNPSSCGGSPQPEGVRGDVRNTRLESTFQSRGEVTSVPVPRLSGEAMSLAIHASVRMTAMTGSIWSEEALVDSAIRPPMQKRTREQWSRVLDAGVTLLEEGGYEAFTIPAICERAQVAVSAIYARAD